MSYLFRAAAAPDLVAVVALLADDPLGATRESSNGGTGDCYRDAFRQIENDPNNDIIVAERDGAVVGCLQLTIIPNLSRSGTTRAQIEGVRVAASERGQGLGKQLMDWAASEARRRNAGIMQLTTDKSRADAHRFYEDLGFVASHEGMKMALE
jgi:GNAT superfamily N-acetyltransferase